MYLPDRLCSLSSASTSSSPTTQAPVALQHIQWPVENESYGVLGEGVSQSIELKDVNNAAYSTVKPLSAPSQSIAVNIVM